MQSLELTSEVVAEQIRRHRKAQQLSQAALGARMGVNKMYISRLERGDHNLSMKTMIRVFLALGLSVRFDYQAI